MRCKKCDGSSIGLGNVSVNVILSKLTWCEHCRETKTEKQNTFFCSLSCFQKFIRDINYDNTEFKWKE